MFQEFVVKIQRRVNFLILFSLNKFANKMQLAFLLFMNVKFISLSRSKALHSLFDLSIYNSYLNHLR